MSVVSRESEAAAKLFYASALSQASRSEVRCSSLESLSSYAVSLGKSSSKIYFKNNRIVLDYRLSTNLTYDVEARAPNLKCFVFVNVTVKLQSRNRERSCIP